MQIKICSLKFPGTCPGWRNLAINDENGNPKEIVACCNRDAARECRQGYFASITSESLEWPENPDRTTIDHSKVGWK